MSSSFLNLRPCTTLLATFLLLPFCLHLLPVTTAGRPSRDGDAVTAPPDNDWEYYWGRGAGPTLLENKRGNNMVVPPPPGAVPATKLQVKNVGHQGTTSKVVLQKDLSQELLPRGTDSTPSEVLVGGGGAQPSQNPDENDMAVKVMRNFWKNQQPGGLRDVMGQNGIATANQQESAEVAVEHQEEKGETEILNKPSSSTSSSEDEFLPVVLGTPARSLSSFAGTTASMEDEGQQPDRLSYEPSRGRLTASQNAARDKTAKEVLNNLWQQPGFQRARMQHMIAEAVKKSNEPGGFPLQ
ncbi:unnamed protein product [Amoebophrya sp. A120]|nr:unnamed protein product [Amoebophrya sp. A120]|eukprot:GSA120T00023221001.1